MIIVEKKIRADKAKASIQKIVGNILAYIFLICWIILLINLFKGQGNWLAVVIVFLLIGAARMLHDKGVEIKKCIDSFENYSRLVSNKSRIKLADLSVIAGAGENAVSNDIETFIKTGYITKIDLNDRVRVVYIGNTQVEMPIIMPKRKMVQVTCAACNGVTEIPVGEEGTCEYCDSKIHG